MGRVTWTASALGDVENIANYLRSTRIVMQLGCTIGCYKRRRHSRHCHTLAAVSLRSTTSICVKFSFGPTGSSIESRKKIA